MQPDQAHSRATLGGLAAFSRERPGWRFSLVTSPAQWAVALREADAAIGHITDPALISAIRRRRLSAVNLSSSAHPTGLGSVHSDEATVGRVAADHVRDRGFRHAAAVGLDGPRFAPIRVAGFQDGFGEDPNGMPIPVWHLDSSALPHPDPDPRLVQFLRDLPTPCAVFGVTDWVARHVVLAARRAGRAVPDDLAVLGVDNDTMVCEFCDPPLSSVCQDPERIGREGCRLLARLLDGQPVPDAAVLIPPRGVVFRRSTDVLAVGDPLVSDALRLVREARGRISPSEVFTRIPLSRRMLEIRFKAALGRTLQEEIWRQRTAEIVRLLEETDRTIADIAEATGFATVSYLTTFLKKRTGTTPAARRRTARRLP